MEENEHDKLVKVDPLIFEAMKGYVSENKLIYPSMKYFVERAIIKFMGFKTFNIEGTEKTYDIRAPLREVVGVFQKGFTTCLVCERPFLGNIKGTDDSAKICPNCKNLITHFAPLIGSSKEDNDE